MPDRTRWLFILGTVLLLVGIATLGYFAQARLDPVFRSVSAPSSETVVKNVHAFTKLYGYVRYFHPSDAAAETDWDAFAVHGARKVKDASSRAELRSDLEALFEPIAPTVKLYRTGSEPPSPTDVVVPSDTTGLRLVAWQYRGIGLGNHIVYPFRSTRLNRASTATTGPKGSDHRKKAPVAQILRVLDANAYRGKQVKVRASVKTDGKESRAFLSLFPFRLGQSLSFNDVAERPITSSTWSVQERTRHVSEARGLFAGGFLKGGGTAWFDDVELFVRDSPEDEWTAVELNNSGFESGQVGGSRTGWRVEEGVSSYLSVTAETASEGDRSLRLASPPLSEASLFPERPAPGKVVNKPIGRGLSVQLPLALYSDGGQTLRPEDAPLPSALRDSVGRVETPILETNQPLRLGDVAIAWNIFQHFYPYFEVVDVDWDAVLRRTLRRALADDASTKEFLQTLRRMVAQLKDGHGRVNHRQEAPSSRLPVRFGQVEGEIAVVDTAEQFDRNLCPEIGDVVVSIDGRPAEQRLQDRKQYISGSPQWTEGRALRQLGRGEPESTVTLTVRRGWTEKTCAMTRPDQRVRWQQLRMEDRPNKIDTLRAGVRYVDLTRAEWPTIRQRIGELANANAVVFDVRGYPPSSAFNLFNHLSGDTLQSARFEVPQFIYPDQKNVAGYDTKRWTFPPKKPRITGDVVFLTGAGAISRAESVMGIVEHYDLGTIVGQPTAGTNGVINPFELPGGYSVWWTGMRVRKHDGSQHHLVGIRPDVRAERTIEGIRNGRDEVLEKALEVLRESPSAAAR